MNTQGSKGMANNVFFHVDALFLSNPHVLLGQSSDHQAYKGGKQQHQQQQQQGYGDDGFSAAPHFSGQYRWAPQ